MKSKVIALAVGAVCSAYCMVGNPTVVMARDANPDTAATMTVQRKPGQSMVLSLSEVGSIFQNNQPTAALHSVALVTDKGKYVYRVVGYSLYDTVRMDIDIITGKIDNVSTGKKQKKIAGRIFNKDQVMAPTEAQAIAVKAVGDDAISKEWKIEADKGAVTYTVTIHQMNKAVDVKVDAVSGKVLSVSKGKVIKTELY